MNIIKENNRRIWMNIFDSNIMQNQYRCEQFQAIHLLIEAIISEFNNLQVKYNKIDKQNIKLKYDIKQLKNQLRDRKFDAESDVSVESFDSHKNSQSKESLDALEVEYNAPNNNDNDEELHMDKSVSRSVTVVNDEVIFEIPESVNNSLTVKPELTEKTTLTTSNDLLANSIVYATVQNPRYSTCKFKKIEDRKLKQLARKRYLLNSESESDNEDNNIQNDDNERLKFTRMNAKSIIDKEQNKDKSKQEKSQQVTNEYQRNIRSNIIQRSTRQSNKQKMNYNKQDTAGLWDHELD